MSTSMVAATSLTGVIQAQDDYKYRPLEGEDEIRVLVFDIAEGGDKLNFTLEHQSLLDPITFDALSYCWGSNLKRKSITCDGATMAVTENLHAALEELARVLGIDSYMNPEGRLWVDAICINQDDVVEKNKQIPLMGRIYSTARRTIAWIGDQDDGSLPTWYVLANRALLRDQDSFRSQWFQRLWIVQEAVLAKDLVVAARTGFMTWNTFANNVLARGLPCKWNVAMIGKLRSQHHRHHQPPYWILEVMSQTEKFQATDERDRLYALYGLVEEISFPVNYSNGYTYVQMAADFAKWALETIPGLSMLSYGRGNSHSDCSNSCASWMLCPGTRSKIYRLLYDSRNSALAVQHRAIVQFEENQKVRLKGVVIDTLNIANYFNIPSIFEDAHCALTKIANSMERIDPSGSKYRRFCAAIDAICIFRNRQSFAKIDMQHFNEYCAAFGNLLLLADSHSLCITKTDKFAWVPSEGKELSGSLPYHAYTETGDMICVFQGGRIPYVIHPQGDGTYTLVGECWIEGFMNEEILTMPEYKFDMITLV